MAGGMGAHVWVPEVSKALGDQICATVSPPISRDRIFRSNYQDDDHLRYPPADRFVTLFWPRFPVDKPCQAGGMVYNTAFDAVVAVTAFDRLEADIENRSTRQMEEDATGTDVMIQQILKSVEGWAGTTDDDENLQIIRRLARINDIVVNRKSGKDDSRWVVAKLNFELSFVADLGFVYPGS